MILGFASSKELDAQARVDVLGDRHELVLSPLILPSDPTGNGAVYGGDLVKDLQELFPAVENHVLIGTPHVYVSEPDVSAWSIDPRGSVIHPPGHGAPPPRSLLPVDKPPKQRRQRTRKRTDQQKKVENARRYVQRLECQARRDGCFAKERRLRAYVREWIHGYAEAIGLVAVDETILPFLPAALREIMARSDAAITAYCGFSGQTKLREELNEIYGWW